jgi:hypothetical protein
MCTFAFLLFVFSIIISNNCLIKESVLYINEIIVCFIFKKTCHGRNASLVHVQSTVENSFVVSYLKSHNGMLSLFWALHVILHSQKLAIFSPVDLIFYQYTAKDYNHSGYWLVIIDSCVQLYIILKKKSIIHMTKGNVHKYGSECIDIIQFLKTVEQKV